MMDMILREFESKKNSVYLVNDEGKLQVVKVHESVDKALFEYDVLTKLALCANVPKVTKVEGNRIYMEYIEGKLAVDYFLECGIREVESLANQMLAFCKVYSDQFETFRLYDTNFRNFIVVERFGDIKLYGVDFEERAEGSLIDSAADLCAFAFLYDVTPEKKRAFYKAIASGWPEQKDYLNDNVFKSLNRLIARRKLNLDVESIFDELVIGRGHMV